MRTYFFGLYQNMTQSGHCAFVRWQDFFFFLRRLLLLNGHPGMTRIVVRRRFLLVFKRKLRLGQQRPYLELERVVYPLLLLLLFVPGFCLYWHWYWHWASVENPFLGKKGTYHGNGKVLHDCHSTVSACYTKAKKRKKDVHVFPSHKDRYIYAKVLLTTVPIWKIMIY